jgi:DNA-binding PadR family transcriptional regulator
MLKSIHGLNNWYRNMQDNKARNPSDFPVLGILYQGPVHGYDLCRKLQEGLGEIWTLRTSHIYARLAGLEKDGLAHHESIDQEARPTKKVFRITDEGRRAFIAWVRSPVMNVREVRLEFLAKLHFARLDSLTAVEDLVVKQLSVCRSAAKRLKSAGRLCKTDTDRDALNYRLAMLGAVEAWLIDVRQPRPHQSESVNEGRRTSRIGDESGIEVCETTQEGWVPYPTDVILNKRVTFHIQSD